MEDTSRSQVTITLGRSGHVVKRSGAVVDTDLLDRIPAAGIKRPVRDRLGSNLDAGHFDNKRQRGINGRLSTEANNGVDDTHLGKHDLRFKIMKKSQRNDNQKNVDLRDMLSQKARLSSTNHKNHQSLTDPKDGQWDPVAVRPRDDKRLMRDPLEVQPRDGRRIMRDPLEVQPRDDRRIMRDPIEVQPRDDRRIMREPIVVRPRDDRRLMRDPIEVRPRDDRRLIRDPFDVGPRDDRRLMRDPVDLGPRDDRRLVRVPIEVDQRIQPNQDPMHSRHTSTRTSRTLSQMDLSKNSFTLESLDHINRPSSHKVLDNSASLSLPAQLPPPSTEEPLRRPPMGGFNEPRPVPYTSRDIHEIPRPMATSFPVKPAIVSGLIKPVGPLVAPQLPTGGMMQQSQFPVDYHSVEGFLHSLGLEKYLISFKVEEVDMATLSQMGENDLKEMSIPMGPRKKILLALHARNRRQPHPQ